MRSICLIIAAVIPMISVSASADEDTGVQAALSHEAISSDIPLAEVQEFTEARVLPMPDCKSVEEWEHYAEQMRHATLERVVFRGEAARWRDAPARVEWLETIPGGPEYHIRKLRYEALPGLWIPALLYEPKKLAGKVPVVLNVNGHDGRDGKAADYKQIRCINMAKRGMLALNVEWIGMGQLNTPGFMHYRLNQLDLCGTSGVSVHFLGMKRALDLLLSHPHADSERVAVAGLSGGGWQTIFISSLDPRVTLSNPVAGYSSFRTRARYVSDLGDSEQTPVDLGVTADYAQLTAMRAPRPTLLTFNAKDQCCFRADHAMQPLLNAAQPVFELYGKQDNLRWHINEEPGNHNFGVDNRQQLYRMFGDHFFPNDESYDPREISCDDELKTKDELLVAIPEDNSDFHQLAQQLSKDLPRNAQLPTEQADINPWQIGRRQRLRELLRFDDYAVQKATARDLKLNGGTARTWQLDLGNWTVPATELVRGTSPKTTVILLTDAGRRNAAKEAEALLEAGNRVVAIDPFYLGESKISQRDFLYGLLVSAVGKRPLGVQSAQVVAVADWARQQFSAPVECMAVGPRTSLIGLTAAAVSPESLKQIRLQDSFGSLKQILEQNMTIQQAPELFCFGLLADFDILQLAALAAPTRVQFIQPSERVTAELAGLQDWYRSLGINHTPVETSSSK